MCYTRLAENTGRKKSSFWHHRTTLSGCIFAAEACIDNRKKKTCWTPIPPPHVLIIWWTYGLLMAEICWRVWGTPANFNGFRILAALLHGTLVVGVSQTLRRWTEGAIYIWQATITLGIGPHSSFVSFHRIGSFPGALSKDVVVKKFTFAIASPDEFLVKYGGQTYILNFLTIPV